MNPTRSPIIGITAYNRSELGFTLPAAYVDAVQLAGGLPILLPPIGADPAQILATVDGLIFSGGGDISPDLYGGSHHPTVYLVDEERDRFELALARAALNSETPVLGICRGMQVLSVASGAALIPHVPEIYGEQVVHRLDHPRRPIEHSVQVQLDSRLHTFLGTTDMTIVSWHHQAVKSVPSGWRGVAQAADGLVEAIEHQQHPWMIGVQWHPELSINDPIQQRLFAAFVQAAKRKG